MAEKKEGAAEILLPEGRIINHSLFVKDKYNEQSVPQYKIELAFEEGVLDDVYEELLDLAVEKWGAGADEDDDLVMPFKDGNKMAKKRERKGKPGDAYKGMEVIRANTIYNKHGEDAPGGVQVFDEDVEEVTGANQSVIYNGCYGQAVVTAKAYITADDERALTFYFQAFQKTRDGERLTSPKDHSAHFKPVERKEGGGVKRRSRKG